MKQVSQTHKHEQKGSQYEFIGAVYPEALLLDYYYLLCIINLVLLLSNGSHNTLDFKLFTDIEQRANR